MDRSGFSVEVRRTDSDLAAFEQEWLTLHLASGTRNPFAHPAWLTTWFRHFVPDEHKRCVVALRREGELVAVAPFYRRTIGRGRTLQLAGSPIAQDPLTEISEVLCLPQQQRQVLRTLVGYLADEHLGSLDWIGLTLPPEHGWFDDDWVPDAWRRRGAFVVHKGLRPFVVLPLPDSWEGLRLKRNVKEAIRRSKNRHAGLAGTLEIQFVDGPGVRHAAELVRDLHRLRAQMPGGVPHRDFFGAAAVSRFALDACERLGEAGGASVVLCQIDGQPVAGRVVLRAGGGVFLSYSGLDPAHWRLGSPTMLMAAVIRRGIADGDRLLNLSLSPDPSKLRWSERIDFHNEFLIVAPSRRSRALFSLFWQARSARVLSDRYRYGARPSS